MIKVTDLTNQEAFPNTKYRFSKVTLENDDAVVLERDFIGENPLHYYLDPKLQEVIVASSIREINGYLKSKGSKFLWEHVRAVSNNKKVTITSNTFYTANPSIIELGPTLQEMPEPTVDVSNIPAAGGYIKNLFVQSIKDRLQTINDTTVGLLLSGGLDSITTGFYLTKNLNGKKLRAFTLKVNEDEADISKSREVAKQLEIPLTEVKIGRDGDSISIDVQVYDSSRSLEKEYHLSDENINEIVELIHELLEKDGVFISESHYLMSLIEALQYDTIYHEHLSYFSLKPWIKLIESYGFEIISVERLLIHGGSIRLIHGRKKLGKNTHLKTLEYLISLELRAGLYSKKTLLDFSSQIEILKLLLEKI